MLRKSMGEKGLSFIVVSIKNKDQTYFLWSLSNEQLAKSLFPIGDTAKENIRQEAETLGLPVAQKKDSQGVCFLGQVDIPDFLSHYIELVPGPVTNEAGDVIGEHQGALVYTLGQRHGFTLLDQNTYRQAMFVLSKDVDTNTLVVGSQKQTVDKDGSITLKQIVLRRELSVGETVEAQIRYRQTPFTAKVSTLEKGSLTLTPEEITELPASGQSCVLYQGSLCHWRWYDSLMPTLITKADGATEYFKVEKLRRSLRRSGASAKEVDEILTEVDEILYDGIKTQEIYRRAFALLRDYRPPAAARYSLRRALFNLGPTGFPFEKFLARLFQEDGYATKTGVMMQGHCATHEIDVAAYKEEHAFVGEAKFHARPGIKSDLQVAMYSHARLLDLRDAKICTEDHCGVKEFWLITNTKFTSSAQDYGNCVGIKMLSWDFPKKDNLHDRIQRVRIYPITVLQNISSAQAEMLIERDVILCKDLLENNRALRYLHLSKAKEEALMAEVRLLCEPNNHSK